MKTIGVCLVLAMLISVAVLRQTLVSKIGKLTADEIAPLALRDCICYNFDACFYVAFRKKNCF